MITRYVPHRDVDAYLAAGWTFGRNAVPCHHDRHSVIMAWLCECEPGVPTRRERHNEPRGR